jgi:ParB family chromosome partitioning protein
MNREHDQIRMIPIDKIIVINSRSRGKKKFRQIIANIAQIGLKRPITVAEYRNGDDEVRYRLGCGQGRLEAYKSLGQTEIPAIVTEATKEDLILISLVENFARRQHPTIEQTRSIADLRDNGDSPADIAGKTGMTVCSVNGILKLLAKGEERLLRAVEKGQMPLSVAVTKAWSALLLPESGRWEAKHREEKRKLLRMEFSTFRQAMVNVPAQILRTGRKIVSRLLAWNPWQHVFFRLLEQLDRPLKY